MSRTVPGKISDLFCVTCYDCKRIQPTGAYTREGAVTELERSPEWKRDSSGWRCAACAGKSK